MEPASFDESNDMLNRPKGMSDEECAPLCIFRDMETPTVISCWKVTKEELDEINRTGRVWLRIWGKSMPPAYVSGVSFFERPNADNGG